MKKLFLLLGLCFLLLPELSLSQKSTPRAHSLLWKITGKDIKEASYLMGTIHLICSDDYVWTKVMQQSFTTAGRLCMEMDLSDPNLMTQAGAMMFDFSGTTLRDYFTDEQEYELVRHFIEDSMHQSIEIAGRMKPVALYMMYSLGVVKGASDCKQTVSYELKLMEMAQAQKKRVSGLETLTEQMEALESISVDTIIRQMVLIAMGQKKDDSDMDRMVNAYKRQDLEALNRLTLSSTTGSGMDQAALIDQRNRNWIPAMGRMMQEGSTFFAVGAGHIYGLLELLQAAGYSVEPIR